MQHKPLLSKQKYTNIYIQYSNFYLADQPSITEFKNILSQLNKMKTVYLCGRILNDLCKPHAFHKEIQTKWGNSFFSREDWLRIEEVARNSGDYDFETTYIFFRGQLLELIRWVLLFGQDTIPSKDTKSFESTEDRNLFIQAALTASKIWKESIERDNFPTDKTIKNPQGLETVLPIARKNLQLGSANVNLYFSLARGNIIFNKYISPNFQKQYHDKANITTQDFFDCSLILISHFMEGYNDVRADIPIFNLENYANHTTIEQTFEIYLSTYVQDMESLKKSFWGTDVQPDQITSLEDVPLFDYGVLLKKPILNLTKNSAIVLDPVAFAQTMTLGCLFHGTAKMQDRASWFGYAFEDYVIYLLNEIFPSSQHLDTRLNTKLKLKFGKDEKTDIDACISDKDSIVTIEIKSGLLKEDNSPTYKNYISTLRDKYVGSQGISQLVTSTKLISNQNWRNQYSNIFPSNLKKIYPVLCVYDSLLVEGLHSKYCATEFKNQLEPQQVLSNGYYSYNNLLVAPPILLSVEDIERLNNLIKKIPLSEVLHQYTLAYPKREFTFKNFIITSEYNTAFKESSLLVENNSELAKRVTPFIKVK